MPRRWNKWMWKTYADLARDVEWWAPRLPSLSAIAGIPRSGIVVASQIAMALNIPLVPIEALIQDVPSVRPTRSRPLQSKPGAKILIVDDTCHSGRFMPEFRNHPALKHRDDLLFGAIYCAPRVTHLVDVWGFPITSRYHCFEWNYLRDGFSRLTLTDMDGVLCEECPADCDDDGPRYAEWAANVKPRVVPIFPVDLIVTARTHSIRQITEDWLRRHGVRFRALATLYQSKEVRSRCNVALDKARVYMANKSRVLFVESSVQQAEEIYRRTRRPVLCTDNRRLYQ